MFNGRLEMLFFIDSSVLNSLSHVSSKGNASCFAVQPYYHTFACSFIMIRKEDILRIMDAVRIEDVIGEYLTLKKRGSNLIGLCPFHNEKTPSFNVSPSLNIFKCFGCGKAGNAVNFLMEYEHYSYPEALRKLAAKFGVELIEEVQDDEYREKKSEEEQAYVVHEFAAKWFSRQLWDTREGSSVALTYFRERGLNDAIVKKFALGYSPSDRDAFARYAASEGYAADVLKKNGLINAESGHDRFRERIIFPIHSISGRVIGFGGRILRSDAKLAKYVNSPETVIYHKSSVLYGLHLAKNSIISNDECFLVEGYMDVISMVQAGVTNVVASSGTSLTPDQIRLIRRYTANVCILYDGDKAGIKASFRAIDMLLAEGLNVRVVLFPDGEDPDSYARNHSASELLAFLQEQKKGFVPFKAEILFHDAGSDPILKAGAMKDIVHSISVIPDGIMRSVLISECASLFGLEEKVLMTELNKMLVAAVKKTAQAEDIPAIETVSPEKTEHQPVIEDDSRMSEAGTNLLTLILMSGEKLMRLSVKNELGLEEVVEKTVLAYIVEQLELDQLSFPDSEQDRIFNVCKKQLIEDKTFNISKALNMMEPSLSAKAVFIMESPHVLSPNWNKHGIYVLHAGNDMSILINEVENAVLEFKLLEISRRIKAVFDEMKNADEENQLILAHQYSVLKKIEVDIDRKIRQRVINK